MSNSVAVVTLSPATMEALASVVARTVALTMTEVLTSGMVPASTSTSTLVESQPKAEAKARRSTKSKATAPKVQRFTETDQSALKETTIGGLRKGTLVQLRLGGAQYRIDSPKGSATVSLAHPKGEVYTVPADRKVWA